MPKPLIRFFFLALMLMIAPPAYAEDELRRLAPSGPWVVDRTDFGCTIARDFGERSDSVSLVISRNAFSSLFGIALLGRPISGASRERPAMVSFGPLEDAQEIYYFKTSVGGRSALLFPSSISIAPMTDEYQLAMDRAVAEEGINPGRSHVASERMDSVEYLVVDGRGIRPFLLELPAFAETFARLDPCIEELLADWAVDVERHRALARPATPIGSPNRWFNMRDFVPPPPDRLTPRVQTRYRFLFRADIDGDGDVTGCTVQQVGRPNGLAGAVCRSIRRRARFAPALDAQGESVASYFVSEVTFTFGQ